MLHTELFPSEQRESEDVRRSAVSIRPESKSRASYRIASSSSTYSSDSSEEEEKSQGFANVGLSLARLKIRSKVYFDLLEFDSLLQYLTPNEEKKLKLYSIMRTIAFCLMRSLFCWWDKCSMHLKLKTMFRIGGKHGRSL